jgi:hypothetical protein
LIVYSELILVSVLDDVERVLANVKGELKSGFISRRIELKQEILFSN